MEKGTGTESALEIVHGVLQEEGLNPQPFVANTTGYVFDPGGELYNGGIVHVLEDLEEFILYFEFREKACESTAVQTAEYLTRANFWIAFGNFEMDYSDWSVRYRSSVYYKGTELNADVVRNTLLLTRISTERYGPALTDVMAGKKRAGEGIAAVEAAMGWEG